MRVATSPAKHPITGKWGVVLTDDLRYTLGGKDWLTPAGFWSDGASIPRPCWSILGLTPTSPQMIGPAIIHDWGYYWHVYSRATADAGLRDGMKGNGIDSFPTWAVYRSVRLFGGSHWANAPEDIAAMEYWVRMWKERDDWPELQKMYRFKDAA